jgi:hypothetical protein
MRASNTALRYRAARNIVRAACYKAGLPTLESIDLRCGCAYWHHAQGLSDHEIAQIMGISYVRTIDRLLRRHLELDAQREMRRALNR